MTSQGRIGGWSRQKSHPRLVLRNPEGSASSRLKGLDVEKVGRDFEALGTVRSRTAASKTNHNPYGTVMSWTVHSPTRLLLCVPGRAPDTSLATHVVTVRATVLYALSTRQAMICRRWSFLRAKPLVACTRWMWLQKYRVLCIPIKRTPTWLS